MKSTLKTTARTLILDLSHQEDGIQQPRALSMDLLELSLKALEYKWIVIPTVNYSLSALLEIYMLTSLKLKTTLK